ncbi:glycosyltransferase family 2 protein [Echinicola sp. CAU 1574]|uniref:Glycosyltransferase family 2 protein n=2 Tax=Echinicola arenosa TaxID=2774144 RepID=A0ABR9ANX4_9BACT|nr:glycosyltransferase family 2 protein [Echinicola arenosa]
MFSVVIPLFNKEQHIEKTIRSVLNQTYKEFEIIIVNDGSTDKSLEVLKKFNDNRIRIFSKENGGVSSARNYGIKKSSYQYIAFLDADDTWFEKYLEKMHSLIVQYPQAGMFNSSYEMEFKKRLITPNSHLEEGLVANYFKLSISSPISWTSATIVKKEVFEEVGYFPEGMIGGEDVFMWTKVAISYPVVFTPEVLVLYNKEQSNIALRAGKKDTCKESWSDLYSESNKDLNKFIAQKAIMKGKRYSWGGFTNESRKIEKEFKYINQYEDISHKWKTLYILNRTPNFIKKLILKIKQN